MLLPTLSGYQAIELLAPSGNSLLFRGHELGSGRPVVIKILASELPSLLDIASLTREYEIIARLELPGVTPALELQSYQGSFALILAAFPGPSLRELIDARTLTIDEAVDLAIDLAGTIGQLHARHVIHKQIQPENIHVDRATGRAVLTNFFCASELEREKASLGHSLDLAYISPEQSGRMNRVVDHRTDFYSFGVTLYELLTRRRPFASSDPVELVHLHIAKEPTPPDRLVPELAGPLTDIVMRLLAKTAEDRYRSAHGIKADLIRCRAIRREHEQPLAFAPASQDRPERLELPQRLYGRERERERLLAAFDRVSQGRVELVLASGYSGIGKSSLVRELQRPIVQQFGYFASGKSDQYKHNIPYHAFVEAFQDLTRQILTESDERIAHWRVDLKAALGSNGQVVLDVIPEFELIIGPQPAIPELEPGPTQNRFNLVIEALIDVFAAAEHPLVLFLDDLQWADPPSLALLRRLLTRSAEATLLLIGAYRDNEVDAAHPLALTLAELREAGAALDTIELGALALHHVEQFVADTLCCDIEHVRPFATLLQSKVAGNPFFLIQMLEHLTEREVLTFDQGAGVWTWELEAIVDLAITDNVVELMISRLGRLPEASQQALQLAACIGNRFSLDLLAAVSTADSRTAARALWQPIVDEMVVPASDDYKVPLALTSEFLSAAIERGNLGTLPIHYKFAHDRIHQAAYALIPAEHKPRVHLQVGQLLLERLRGDSLGERIFDVVSNLNLGASLLRDEALRAELAALNLEAGRRARSSAAYPVARAYLEKGLELVGDAGWNERYELTLALHVAAIEARHLANDTVGAEQLSAAALGHVAEVLDEAKIQKLRILFLNARNEFHAAIAVALAMLIKLGVDVEAMLDDPNELANGFRAELTARGMEITDLPKLPEMTSASHLVAMEILTGMNEPAFLAAPALWPKVCFMMARLCVRHGNSFASGFVYVYIGNILCGMLEDIELGYAIGQLAQQLPERFYAKRLRVQSAIPYNLAIRHWKEPLRNTFQAYYEGIQDALAIGDIAFAAYHSANYANLPVLVSALTLESVFERQAKYMAMSRALGQIWPVSFFEVWMQFTLNLLGKSDDPMRLVGEAFDEDRQIPVYEALPSPTLLFMIYVAKCVLAYLFGDYRGAVEFGEAARRHELGAQGFSTVPILYSYHGLALLALAGQSDEPRKSELRERARVIIAKYQRWAEHGPANYLHKYHLLLAEDEASFGDPLRALELYDLAISGAGTQGFLQEQALAHERAGELYARLGRVKAAATYFESAHHGYLRWGAQAKAEQLSARIEGRHVRDHSTASSTSLDLEAVIRASHALSSEIVLARLLDKLIKTILANAGAQRAVLLVEREGRWFIEVEGRVSDEGIDIELVGPSSPNSGIGTRVAAAIVNYTARTGATVLLDDAAREGQYTRDAYVVSNRVASVLCIPLLLRMKLSGVLYLENNLTTHAFSRGRVELLTILLRQAAIAIENARLYERLEDHSRSLEERVRERTATLDAKNRELGVALDTLKNTQARFVAQEKLAALGVLTSGIAHEVRNPLNIVVNFAELTHELRDELSEALAPILAGFEGPQRQHITTLLENLGQAVDNIHSHGLRADKIINDMRVLSRGETGEVQQVDVASLVREALALAQHSERIQSEDLQVVVACEIEDSLGSIEAFPADLSRALINIIGNALYAADAGSQTPRVQVRARVRGEQVEIRVHDNGSGIPPEIRAEIFAPFFTTKPPDRGTGLGLSISHDIIVQLHGGSISVSSEPGDTEFVILLPRRHPRARHYPD
jgi:predicted ATPase/signal transduction histidine kinase